VTIEEEGRVRNSNLYLDINNFVLKVHNSSNILSYLGYVKSGSSGNLSLISFPEKSSLRSTAKFSIGEDDYMYMTFYPFSPRIKFTIPEKQEEYLELKMGLDFNQEYNRITDKSETNESTRTIQYSDLNCSDETYLNIRSYERIATLVNPCHSLSQYNSYKLDSNYISTTLTRSRKRTSFEIIFFGSQSYVQAESYFNNLYSLISDNTYIENNVTFKSPSVELSSSFN